MRPLVAATLTLLLCGCSGLGREFNQALPEFLRDDPGEEEMLIFAKVRQGREWTPEDEQNQLALMEEARTAWDENRYDDTLSVLELYLEQYPTSTYDEEARFLIGQTQYLNDDLTDAFRSFKDFAALYPVAERNAQVIEMEYQMGKEFIEGKHGTFFGLFGHRGRGVEMLNHLVETFPSGARAADAQWLLARYYHLETEWAKAEGAFGLLVDNYSYSEWYAPGLYYYAYALYRQVKGEQFDPQMMEEARDAFRVYLREIEEGAWRDDAQQIVAQLDEMQAQHLLGIGEWYLYMDKPYSARYYFKTVIARYPESAAAATAAVQLPELEDVVGPEGAEPGGEPAEGRAGGTGS